MLWLSLPLVEGVDSVRLCPLALESKPVVIKFKIWSCVWDKLLYKTRTTAEMTTVVVFHVKSPVGSCLPIQTRGGVTV